MGEREGEKPAVYVHVTERLTTRAGDIYALVLRDLWEQLFHIEKLCIYIFNPKHF